MQWTAWIKSRVDNTTKQVCFICNTECLLTAATKLYSKLDDDELITSMHSIDSEVIYDGDV